MKKIMIILMLVMAVIGLTAQTINAGGELASETIQVRVNIPVMQGMDVVNPVVVDINSAFAETDQNEVIIKEAGTVRVQSNADWSLQVSNIEATDSKVLVRRTGQTDRDWQPVSNSKAVFNGSNGDVLVSFDLKIVETETNPNSRDNLSSNNRVVFDYMLVQN